MELREIQQSEALCVCVGGKMKPTNSDAGSKLRPFELTSFHPLFFFFLPLFTRYSEKLHPTFNTHSHTEREKVTSRLRRQRDAVSCRFAIRTFHLRRQRRTRSCKSASPPSATSFCPSGLSPRAPNTPGHFRCPPSSAEEKKNGVCNFSLDGNVKLFHPLWP